MTFEETLPTPHLRGNAAYVTTFRSIVWIATRDMGREACDVEAEPSARKEKCRCDASGASGGT
jgi:hypothetical protein